MNEIKSEFIEKYNNEDKDNDLFCKTSLLYEKERFKFSLGNIEEDKILQHLENELLNSTNKKYIYETTYNPYSLFCEAFKLL